MKVVLLQPPAAHHQSSIEYEPLGLAYLAASLEKAGHSAAILEADLNGWDCKRLADEALKLSPKLIGVTAAAIDYENALKTARLIKETSTIPIVIGGPHASSSADEVEKAKIFDAVIVGEGDETIVELADYFNQEPSDYSKISKIKGLAVSAPREPINDIDQIPFPARHLLHHPSKYQPSPGSYKNRPIAGVITSRGCPFNCIFCSHAVFGHKVRFRSPENVVLEVEQLLNDYKVKEIRFWDDTFNLDRQRVFKICELINTKGLKFSWSCQGRVDCLTKELAKEMAKAGCWQICFGLESGSQEMLDKMKKNISLEAAEKAVREAKNAGLETKGFFILGLPGETKQTIQQTINFARRLPLDLAQFSLATPFPGTVFKEQVQNQLKTAGFSSFQQMYSGKSLPYAPPTLTAKELGKAYQRAYKSFYIRPSFIIKKIAKPAFWRKGYRSLFALMKLLFAPTPD